MSDESSSADLEARKRDLAAHVARGVLGAAPFIGPILAEIIGSLLPQRRIERVEALLQQLDARLETADQETLQKTLMSPESIDLLDAAMRQAARSTSRIRQAYLAELLARALTREELEYSQVRTLFDLLDQLGEPELAILASYGLPPGPARTEYRARHVPRPAMPGADPEAPESDLEDHPFFRAWRANLLRLGLLEPRFDPPEAAAPSALDPATGMMKVSHHALAPLGHLLLQSIGLPYRA